MKIFLTNFQSPGDVLMLTSCVRDLKASHPEISINVQTSAMELWNNNPYLDRRITKANADRVIEMHYPLINQSTQGQFHFIHGFRLYLEEQLGIKICPREFCVDITIQFRNPMLKEKWNEWSNEVTEDIWKVVEQYGAFLYIEDYTFHFSLDFQIE